MTATRLSIEYMRLDAIRRYAANAKDHDLGLLSESVYRFGFNEPLTIAENWQILAAGHGRLDTLEQAHAEHQPLPDHIDVDRDGMWLAPVVRGVSFADEHELRAYIIAANRATERGGWHDDLLLRELQALAEADVSLDGVGYDLDDLDMLLRDAEIATALDAPPPLDQGSDDEAPTTSEHQSFGAVVVVADALTEEALLSLLNANGYTARRLADPVGKYHAYIRQSPAHPETGA